MKMCETVLMLWPWTRAEGTEATALGELRTEGGGVNNPDMMNSANKKVYQIFIFNNC